MSKDLSGPSRDLLLGRSQTRDRVTDRSIVLDEYIEEDHFRSTSHTVQDIPTHTVPQETDKNPSPSDSKGSHFQTTGGRNLLHDDHITQSTSATVSTASRHTWEQISSAGLEFQLQPAPDGSRQRPRRESITSQRPLPTPRASSGEMSTTHSRSFYTAPELRASSHSDYQQQQPTRGTPYEPRQMGSVPQSGVYTSPSLRSDTVPTMSSYYSSSPRHAPQTIPSLHHQPQPIAGPSSARVGHDAVGQRDMPIRGGSTRPDDQPTHQQSTRPPSLGPSPRSLSISPLVSTRQTPGSLPDGTPRTQHRDLPDGHFRGGRQSGHRVRDERSLSPTRAHASGQPIMTGTHASVSYTAEYNRPPGGAVASFFSRPPSRSAQKSNKHVGSIPASPPPTGPSTTSDSRYPGIPPSNVAPRSASPLKSKNPDQAWFKLGTPPNPRDLSSWSIDHVRAYDAGFEDAIRAVEHGTVGFGSDRYSRPLLVRGPLPDGAAPSHSASRRGDEVWRPSTRPLHTPISSQSIHQPPPPPPPAPYPSRIPPQTYHSGPLLPPNPQMVSPYEYHYGSHGHSHPSYPGGPISDGYNDPYRYQHSHQSMFYPNLHSHGMGVGPQRSQRQLISCYPCRGRKLKCDGQKPCAQCVRRGSEADCAYATHVRRRGKGKKSGGGSGSSEEPISPGGEGMERGDSGASGSSIGGQVELGRSAPISPLVDGSPFDGPPFSQTPDGYQKDSSPTDELREIKEELDLAIQMDGGARSSQPEVQSEPEDTLDSSRRSSDEKKLPFGGPAFYASMGLGQVEEKQKGKDE